MYDCKGDVPKTTCTFSLSGWDAVAVKTLTPLKYKLDSYITLSLLVSPHVYAWARAKHFGCHSVCLSFCHHGNSLSGLQTWTSRALQPLVFLHWWKKSISIVILYLESHARYRKSRKLEKPFFGRTSLKFYFRRSIKGLKICQYIIFKTYV